MAQCACRRKVQEYQCRVKTCPNKGEIYCQECVNEFQRHVHKATKYTHCRDEECAKWDKLFDEADQIYKVCDPLIKRIVRLAKYLEEIAGKLGIATEHTIIKDFEELTSIR
jgi:hypothetical protein